MNNRFTKEHPNMHKSFMSTPMSFPWTSNTDAFLLECAFRPLACVRITWAVTETDWLCLYQRARWDLNIYVWSSQALLMPLSHQTWDLSSEVQLLRTTSKITARGRWKPGQMGCAVLPSVIRPASDDHHRPGECKKHASVSYIIAHPKLYCRAKFVLWLRESVEYTASPNLINAYLILTIQPNMDFCG